MNKKYYYIVASILLFAMISLSGCKKNDRIYEEVNLDSIFNAKLKEKINELFPDNGVYLYDKPGDKGEYLILNSNQTNSLGEIALYSDVKVEIEEDTMMIYYTETMKTYTPNEEADKQFVYKIKSNKQCEYIRIYKNGEESYFDSIGA